jgi:phosphocarrier protein HPr
MTNRSTSHTKGVLEVSRRFTVLNEKGLHARPAALLVKTANQFVADILLQKDGNEVSAKSIISVLTLEGYSGAVIDVTARGADAVEAMDAVQELFDNRFHEE